MNLSLSSTYSRKLQVLVKVVLTLTAIYFVYTQVPFQDIYQIIQEIHLHHFLGAFAMFNISKVVSAFRLNRFYRETGLHLTERFNLKLYYVGMFYNLFLPGSVGGDGYKVFLLRQQHQIPTRQIASATLLDRLSGLAVLTLLTLVFVLYSEYVSISPYIQVAAWLGLILVLPLYYLMIRWVFSRFLPAYMPTTHLSCWVQVGQVACAVFILQALSVDSHYFGYLTLFMLSSVVAVLPISIGGVGVRELVFLYGVRYLNVEASQAVAFAVLFFAVVAMSSLVGLLILPYLRKQSSQ